MMDKNTLLKMLPSNGTIDFLMKIFLKGKRICPVYMAYHPLADEMIELEADLDQWGVVPYDGSSGDWPLMELTILRMIRALRGANQPTAFPFM